MRNQPLASRAVASLGPAVFSALAAAGLALAGCGPTLHEQSSVSYQYAYDPSYTVIPVAVAPYVRVEQPVATVVRFEVPAAWSYTWSPTSRVRVICGRGAGVFAPTLEYGRRYVVAVEGSYGASDCRVALARSYEYGGEYGGGSTAVVYRGGYEYSPPSSGYVLRPVRYRMDL